MSQGDLLKIVEVGLTIPDAARHVLRSCEELSAVLVAELKDVDTSQGDRVEIIETVIRRAGEDAQRTAVEWLKENYHTMPDRGFPAAAGAELVGIHDAAKFSVPFQARDIDPADWTKRKKSVSSNGKMYRQLHASVWLGKGATPSPVTASPMRREGELLDAFLSAIITYTRDNLDELRKLVRTSQATLGAGPIEPEVEFNSGYIRRDAYHDEFARILTRGTKCIVIAGLPGVGKTKLVEALIQELPPTLAPYVFSLSGPRGLVGARGRW